MAEFLDMIESMTAQDASVTRLFSNGDGTGVRTGGRAGRYSEQELGEARRFVADILAGRRPAYHLQEALSTSDFPQLFGDVIDRMLLGSYRETPQTFRAYCAVKQVRDFRTVKRFAVDGGEGVLSVVNQGAEYPEASVADSEYSYAVKKYGRKMPFLWETMINDDLDALRDIPQRFGRASRRTEERFATGLFVGASGPLGTFFTGGNANVVTSNPVLSIAALQTAFTVLAAQVDTDGEPILIDAVHLVVPPALAVTAQNILNALEIEAAEAGGTSNQKLRAANWMKNVVTLHVNPYIPLIATSANGSTSWFLFADPADGRPAIEVGFLRGHTEPEVFMKAPNATRVGGGTAGALDGDFETDAIEYKVRHVIGGTVMDPKMAVASNGSGS